MTILFYFFSELNNILQIRGIVSSARSKCEWAVSSMITAAVP